MVENYLSLFKPWLKRELFSHYNQGWMRNKKKKLLRQTLSEEWSLEEMS